MFTCPSIKAKVSGKEYELRMDFNAVSAAERLTGKNLLDAEIWRDMDASTVTALFWACAIQCGEQNKITLNDVRSGTFKHATEMIDAVRKAWRAANDVPEEDPVPTSGSKQAASADAFGQ
jgi:hypothetical protein